MSSLSPIRVPIRSVKRLLSERSEPPPNAKRVNVGGGARAIMSQHQLSTAESLPLAVRAEMRVAKRSTYEAGIIPSVFRFVMHPNWGRETDVTEGHRSAWIRDLLVPTFNFLSKSDLVEIIYQSLKQNVDDGKTIVDILVDLMTLDNLIKEQFNAQGIIYREKPLPAVPAEAPSENPFSGTLENKDSPREKSGSGLPKSAHRSKMRSGFRTGLIPPVGIAVGLPKNWGLASRVLRKIDPGLDNGAMLSAAASVGDESRVKSFLLNERVDPSACNNRALSLSEKNGHLRVVKLLLADERVRVKLSRERGVLKKS